jgi:predicted DNA-binding transcriptional regulator YafY
MRRADRLFQIIQVLRRGRLTTATQLAERLEVSERTIYRDVKDLMASGVPIEGEAGVGYIMGLDFDLPPMMFSHEEVQALVLGARMVESFGDASLRTAARSVLDKVEAVLPEDLRAQVESTALFSLPFVLEDGTRERLGWLREGIDQRRKMRLEYRDQKDQNSERVVRPLGLYF